MTTFQPSRIIIEKEARRSPLTKKILAAFPAIKHSVIKNITALPSAVSPTTLIIAKQKGAIIVPCPGTPSYICCNYYIIDIGFGCLYNCSYCFLHQYRNTPGLIIYANIHDALKQIKKDISVNRLAYKRIGTGEFTDSLLLDHITGYSKKLVNFFSDKYVSLELKTKSTNIRNLLGLKHNRRSVIAWSLNPDSIAKTEEPAAAPLLERLEAAKICESKGYPLGFHFDPIIFDRSTWEEEYKELIRMMKKMIPPNHVVWISLGTLRFNPNLKPLIQKHFPKSTIIYEEMVRGTDGKLRYLQPIRIEIYKKMYDWLKNAFPKTPIYLCMENKTVWERTLNFAPQTPQELEEHIISRWQQLLD